MNPTNEPTLQHSSSYDVASKTKRRTKMGQGSKKDGCKPATGHYKGDRTTAGENIAPFIDTTNKRNTRQNQALSISGPAFPDFYQTKYIKYLFLLRESIRKMSLIGTYSIMFPMRHINFIQKGEWKDWGERWQHALIISWSHHSLAAQSCIRCIYQVITESHLCSALLHFVQARTDKDNWH